MCYNKILNVIALAAVIILTGCAKANAQSEKSTKFFVAGHVYGNPSIRLNSSLTERPLGFYPSFMTKIKNDIPEKDIEMGVLTGDIVYRSTKEEWDAVGKNILDIGVPIHIAPGNHDVVNDFFVNRYATNHKTYYSFVKDNDLYIVLDTNISPWNIEDEQLKFLQETLSTSGQFGNVFVFVHHIIWWEGIEPHHSIINSNYLKPEFTNFRKVVYPLFAKLANPVYIIAGDTGIYPHHVPEQTIIKNVHLIASGMGSGLHDNYTLVTVPQNKDKAVNIEFVWFNKGKYMLQRKAYLERSSAKK